jgi:uncharacterized protein (DUF983 family)
MSEPNPRGLPHPPLGTMLARGARVRCAFCGGGPLLESWTRPRARCPRCGLRTDRGKPDFFLGAMVFNIALSEGVLALLIVGVLVAMHPVVPWNFLQYGGVALMVLAPIVFLPVSRTLWMAIDILLHPVTPDELEHPEAADLPPDTSR